MYASALGRVAPGEEADVASFVQRSASEQRGFKEKDFDPEDAESLVHMAYQAAHDESKPTLEEKAISLLQDLAQHRSVAGTGARQALLNAAAESQKAADSNAYEAEADLEAKGNSSMAGPLEGHHFIDVTNNFDWVDIPTKDGKAGEEGYCWHSLGGKPLQCQVAFTKGQYISDSPMGKHWEFHGYSNPCEAWCGRSSWCSGYGYKLLKAGPGTSSARDKEVCTLFNKGSKHCDFRDLKLQGLLPVHSARDLVLEQPRSNIMRLKKDGVFIKMPYLRYKPNGKYICKAKYQDPPKDSIIVDKGVGFVIRSESTKCKHVLSKEGKPVYIQEAKAWPMSLPFVDEKTFSDREGNKKDWANKCEKLCSMFRWCTGYAYKAPKETEQEACGMYSARSDFVESPDGWQDGTKQTGQGSRQPRPAYTIARIATHFVPDEEEPGWICKAKTYDTNWRTDSGAGIQCKTNPVGIIMTTTMSVLSFLSAASCDSLASSATTTTTMAANSSSNSSSRMASQTDTIGSVEDPLKLTSLFALESKRAAEHFTEGQARSALAHFLNDTDGDSGAISALRSSASSKTMCQVQFSGQGLRFLSYAIAMGFNTAYKCTALHREKYQCKANLLRVTGGLFGSVMYGYPRLQQECGSNPWPVTSSQCVADFSKTAYYLGKSIWKMIQTTWFLDEEKTWEKVAGGVDVLASLTFIAEGILRALGPCLGKLSGDDSKIQLENGACVGTIAEVSALSVQTVAYGLSSFSNCRDWYRAPDGL